MAGTASQLSLKGRALRYLAGREHSRVELQRKLAKYEEEPGTLQQVLDALQAKDFISEQRTADSVVRRRGARLGAARVRQELMAKGLETDIVVAAVQTLRATEQARAHEVWRKKFGAAAPDASGRAKQMRFLAARGFAPDAIRRVVAGSDDDF